MLICNSVVGREWYVASSTVEKRLWPVHCPGPLTQASALLNRSREAGGPQDVRADSWIKNFRADRYWIKEDSILWTNRSVLSLIWWEDESQLIDLDNFEDETGSWRSDKKRNWD
jgi:hypothetical protein